MIRKTIFFLYFHFLKNSLDQSRGKGLYLKDLMTITMQRVPIRKTIFVLYFDFLKKRLDQFRGEGLYLKDSMTITM